MENYVNSGGLEPFTIELSGGGGLSYLSAQGGK